jgi:hypothetical protein
MPGSRNPYQSIADAELCSEAFAKKEDEKDALSKLRKEFVIPTKGDLKNKKYGFQRKAESASYDAHAATQADDDNEESIYFCGNSLGLQPRRTRDYVNRYLDTWASKGVFGHFTDYDGGLPPWLHLDDATKKQTAEIVGALPSEVVVMETLTANLHLLMSSFYRPTADRWKIIIEGKAFPSDHVSNLTNFSCTQLTATTVRRPLANRPPQPRPLGPHHHRTALRLLALHLHRAHPLRNLQTRRHNRSRPTAGHTVLLGPVPRHRADNAPLPLQRHPHRLGLGPRSRQCAREAARLERRLRSVV